MDEHAMIDPDIWPMLVTLAASFAGGVLLGTFYFHALGATADLIISGEHPLLAIILTLGRLGFLGAGFYFALQGGTLALLAALAGVLAGRGLTMRRMRAAEA
jgi:F1F0 ATPase subunit 2